MSKIRVWVCDICKKEFHPSDIGYEDHREIEIIISGDINSENYGIFEFEDTCQECRKELSSVISYFINKKLTPKI